MKAPLFFVIPLCICGIVYVWQISEISELRQKNKELKQCYSSSHNEPSFPFDDIDPESDFLARSERISQLAKVLPLVVNQRKKHLLGYGLILTEKEQNQYLLLLEEFYDLQDDELFFQLENIKESAMLNGRDWVSVASFLIEFISEKRPVVALDLLVFFLKDSPSQRYASICNVLGANPEESFNWLQENQNKLEAEGMSKRRLEKSLLPQIGRKNPEFVMEYCIQNEASISIFENIGYSLSSNEERSRFVRFFRNFVESSIFKKWNKLERQSKFQFAIKSFVGRMMHEPAKRNIEWVSQTLTTTEKEYFASGIVDQMPGVHPVHVANREHWGSWLMNELSVTHSNRQVIQKYVALWIHEDHMAAGEWLNAQAPGVMKNEAIYTYSSKLAFHDPKTAMEWAETLPTSNRKEGLIKSIQAQEKH